MNKILAYLTAGITSAYLALAPVNASATSTPLHERFYPVKKRIETMQAIGGGEPQIIKAHPFNPGHKLPLELIVPFPEAEFLDIKNREYKPNFMPMPRE